MSDLSKVFALPSGGGDRIEYDVNDSVARNNIELMKAKVISSLDDVMANTKTDMIASANTVKDMQVITYTWQGQLAKQTNYMSFPAHMIIQKFPYNKANIHIQCKCETNNYTGSDKIVDLFTDEGILNVLGCKYISWSTYNTRAIVFDPTNNVFPIPDYLGRTGLLVEYRGAPYHSFLLSRIYNDAMTFGGWGTESELYKAGLYYIMDIYGASISY